jgi:hypothetical protein
VIQEVSNRDLLDGRWDTREESRQGIVVSERPLLGQEHDRHRGEWLRHRADERGGVLSEPCPRLEIGQTVALAAPNVPGIVGSGLVGKLENLDVQNAGSAESAALATVSSPF